MFNYLELYSRKFLMFLLNYKLPIVDHFRRKTSLLHTFVNGSFPDGKYSSTNSKHEKTTQSAPDGYRICYTDTRNTTQEDRDRLLAYPFSHIVLLCVDVSRKEDLAAIKEKWMVEISHHCHNKPPCYIVGLKADLPNVISESDLAAQSGCTKAYVLSAKTDQAKVKSLFDDVARAGVDKMKKLANEPAQPQATSNTSNPAPGRRRGCTLL